jgi:hypothetical protein
MKITFPEFIPYPGNEGHLTEDELSVLNCALVGAWMAHVDHHGQTPFGPVKMAQEGAARDIDDIRSEILPFTTPAERLALVRANMDITAELYDLTHRDANRCAACKHYAMPGELRISDYTGHLLCKNADRCVARWR